jgi:hypothetical protein
MVWEFVKIYLSGHGYSKYWNKTYYGDECSFVV